MSPSPTVLVVDDEEPLLVIVARWLARAGYQVLTATNGRDGLAIAATRPVDLIVSDVRMPVMDGVEMVTRLPGLVSVLPRVVFVSGFNTIDQASCAELGVAAILEKPVDKHVLLETIGRLAVQPGAGAIAVAA